MPLKKPVYLDHHATTPVDPAVFEIMKPYFLDDFGNAASRTHLYGQKSKASVDDVRNGLVGLINASSPNEIIFTSGATESNNIAILGLQKHLIEIGKTHIISSPLEHKSVLDVCMELEVRGFKVTFLNVDEEGRINLKELEVAITKETGLISLMHVNNEIGSINPIEQVGKIAEKQKIYFHVDAAQSFGKVPIDVQKLGIHLLSISGHKIYGPKGVGVLYVCKSTPRVPLQPVMFGGGHETGLRSGTLSTPLIVGLGAAAQLSYKLMSSEKKRIKGLRDLLLKGLQEKIPDTHVNGSMNDRLVGNLNVSFDGIDSEALMYKLKDEIAVSNGSACTSVNWSGSYVLKAMGLSEERILSAIRFGIGRFNTKEEIEFAVVKLSETIDELRKLRTL
jgi:cysteine desulfurase